MQISKEMEADVVSVLWVCPEANAEFREKATIPAYLKERYPEMGLFDTWRRVVGAERFQGISTESLRGILLEEASGEGADVQMWADYSGARYGW